MDSKVVTLIVSGSAALIFGVSYCTDESIREPVEFKTEYTKGPIQGQSGGPHIYEMRGVTEVWLEPAPEATNCYIEMECGKRYSTAGCESLTVAVPEGGCE